MGVDRIDYTKGIGHRLKAFGELLAGFDDEWAIEVRAAHRDALADVLERLAQRSEAAGDLAAAVGWTRRQAAVDPLQALGYEAFEQLMGQLRAIAAGTGDAHEGGGAGAGVQVAG